jgi:diacylglycerol kinase
MNYAAKGLHHIFTHEQNFRIQCVIGLFVFLCSIFLPLGTIERIVIIGLILMVLILEICNSVVEQLADILKPRLNYQVKSIKDMMAAAVLIAALGSLGIGAYIFTPYFIEVFFK